MNAPQRDSAPRPPPLGGGRGVGSPPKSAPARPAPVEAPTARLSPLAQLNAHIAEASLAAAGEAASSGERWPELRSAQRFRETWERIAAESQVQQVQARAPQNAGPLNPQRLMGNTLAQMGELSPHYLRRFLAHAETLLWLEQAQAVLKQGALGKGAAAKSAKPAKAARQKK